ncbi:MAG TPA: glycine oxidase ThiO [Jatrophihabitans sp.]|nr:glycine oxidase ThiO [Jatrophihabitans sp.]
MTGTSSPAGEVLIVGGGVIGLAAGYRLAGAGHQVRLVDASAGRGASWVAAGMLAPVSEAGFGEDELTRLNLAAVEAFVRFAEELAALLGESIGLRDSGTLVVAVNADDRAALDRLSDHRETLGLRTERLTGSRLRELEPYLTADARAGVLAADDLSVDNRRYLDALRAACRSAGVRIEPGEVCELLREDGRVSGARLGSGACYRAELTVLCAGAGTERLLPVGVRPVKGQILRLAVPERLAAGGPVLRHTVRGLVRGSEIYLVPRAGGEVVVGATSEQQGEDTTVTAGAVYELLRNAYEVLPISSEFTFVEASAGTRPGTGDNGPLVGWFEPGLLVASGHYRNGILLSALTAEALTALAAGEQLAPHWQPFDPRRFSGKEFMPC